MVGKSAYLTTDPLTIQRGKSTIAQAIMDHRVKARGPGCPHVNLLAQQPFQFNPFRSSLQKTCLEMVVLTTHHHLTGLLGARNITGIGETRGLNHLSFLHLLQTVGLRVTEVHYQQPPLCCPGLTGQMDQGIPDEVDDTERKHA